MSIMQFLSSLPALLGLTGFVVYFFLARGRSGDRITIDIVAKLRQEAPDRLPPGVDKLDAASLAALIENDTQVRAKVSEQDFQLLRDALRQQFLISLIVYAVCTIVFISGVVLFVYMSTRPTPVVLSSISAESSNPDAHGAAVDLDELQVRWSSRGDPEDVTVALENMDTHRRTDAKVVSSTEGKIIFSPEDYRALLTNRMRGGQNRMRISIQSEKSTYLSPEFVLHVGTTILATHIDSRIKIIGVIDNRAIDFYDFEAKLAIWASAPGQSPAPITYGGQIKYGHNDFALDPRLTYDWGSAKLVYFGPDDPRFVRKELLGF